MADSLPSPLAPRRRSSVEEDRREADRKHRRLGITWRMLGEKEHLMTPGEVHNFSKHGMACRLDAPVKSGGILVVTLDEPPAGFEEPFLLRIKHVTVHEAGGWLAGCSFTRRFTEAEFQVLLNISREPLPESPSWPGGMQERRAAPREEVEKWLSVRLRPVNLLRPEVTGRLKDRSKGGLGLISQAAFPAGSILDVRLEQTEISPWVQLRVVHCRSHEREWILGCQFTEMPSSDALSQFMG